MRAARWVLNNIVLPFAVAFTLSFIVLYIFFRVVGL